MSIQHFSTAIPGGALVTLTPATVTQSGDVVGIRLNTNGTVDRRNAAAYTQINAATDWILPNAAASGSYEAMATIISGSGYTGTFGSWLALSSAREWSKTSVNAVGVIEVSIRRGGTVLATAQFTLDRSV